MLDWTGLELFFTMLEKLWYRRQYVGAMHLLPSKRPFLTFSAMYYTIQSDILVLFFHNSYGTPEFPDCGNLAGADWMENLRWGDTKPSMHFRETNTDPSMHFRKANTDLSMHFRKANTEFLLPVLLPTLFTISLPSLLLFLLPVLIPT